MGSHNDLRAEFEYEPCWADAVTTILVLLLGIVAGIMVGLMGIGGGIVLVPAMVHVLHMDQHLAQGTSLFILLPPIGLGALRQYWKAGNVDLRAGMFCATGMILGAYLGSKIAVPMSTQMLKGFFGAFLMFSAVLLWMKARPAQPAAVAGTVPAKESSS
jgi:uncharacterized membrane protein YfcA